MVICLSRKNGREKEVEIKDVEKFVEKSLKLVGEIFKNGIPYTYFHSGFPLVTPLEFSQIPLPLFNKTNYSDSSVRKKLYLSLFLKKTD